MFNSLVEPVDSIIATSEDAPEHPSYLTPHAEGREIPSRGGHGVFAVVPIKTGEIVAVFGGRNLLLEEVLQLPAHERSKVLQIGAERFLWSVVDTTADWINHSCAPNCGFLDDVTLVAMREIEVGEELTFDYAMADSVSYDEFRCECGAQECRGQVQGSDWQRGDLRERYGNLFSPYLRVDSRATLRPGS